jgi:diketogulonate reductase-like aldo/keto reductase
VRRIDDAAAVVLAWTIRSGNVIAIPESGSPAHVKENAVALALTFTRKSFKHWMPRTRPWPLTRRFPPGRR